MTEGHVTFEKRPFENGNLIQTGQLISIHFFCRKCESIVVPKHFIFGYSNHQRKENFGLTLSKKKKKTQIHA